MKCPTCSSTTKTLDTREVDRYVRRRRQCLSCRRRFTTAEGVVDDYASSNIMMVQRKTMEELMRVVASAFSPTNQCRVSALLKELAAGPSTEVPDA